MKRYTYRGAGTKTTEPPRWNGFRVRYSKEFAQKLAVSEEVDVEVFSAAARGFIPVHVKVFDYIARTSVVTCRMYGSVNGCIADYQLYIDTPHRTATLVYLPQSAAA